MRPFPENLINRGNMSGSQSRSPAESGRRSKTRLSAGKMTPRTSWGWPPTCKGRLDRMRQFNLRGRLASPDSTVSRLLTSTSTYASTRRRNTRASGVGLASRGWLWVKKRGFQIQLIKIRFGGGGKHELAKRTSNEVGREKGVRWIGEVRDIEKQIDSDSGCEIGRASCRERV